MRDNLGTRPGWLLDGVDAAVRMIITRMMAAIADMVGAVHWITGRVGLRDVVVVVLDNVAVIVHDCTDDAQDLGSQ